MKLSLKFNIDKFVYFVKCSKSESLSLFFIQKVLIDRKVQNYNVQLRQLIKTVQLAFAKFQNRKFLAFLYHKFNLFSETKYFYRAEVELCYLIFRLI